MTATGAGARVRAEGSAARPAPAAPGTGRDPFFDNAKYLAIVLVACAHAWEPFRDGSRTVDAVYVFVYAFHMPAFIVISGYFSRTFELTGAKMRRLVGGVVVPYVVFETALTLFRRWAGDDPDYPVNLINPYYLTWFLIALFVWRLTAPLWRGIRWPVTVSFVVAVAAALTPGMTESLDIQRVLQFLPFFVVGLSLRPEHFALLRRPAARPLAALVLGAGAVCAWWAVPRMNRDWFFHRVSVQELGVSAPVGVAMTLGVFACSLALTAAFLAWVPRRRMWFTVLGAGTLYGYLLHGFLIKGSRFWGWYDHPWVHTRLGVIVFTLGAAAVVTLLCTPPVRRLFRPVMEARLTWLFKNSPSRPEAGAQGRAPTASD